MSYPDVSAEPPEFRGVRVTHPTIVSYIRNGITQGWSNEKICTVVGMPAEVVDRERAKLKKEQAK